MDEVRRTSSLPSGVFKAFDTQVEDKLTGSVAEVFLRHMTTTSSISAAAPLDADTPERPENLVSAEEIERLLSGLRERAVMRPPDVDSGLDSERTWVLADLAVNGSGRARELATRELREFVTTLAQNGDPDCAFLKALVTSLEVGREPEAENNVLLDILLGAARHAIECAEESGSA